MQSKFHSKVLHHAIFLRVAHLFLAWRQGFAIVSLICASPLFAQSDTHFAQSDTHSTTSDLETNRSAQYIRRLAESGIINVGQMPSTLPVLVDALRSTNPSIRNAAARGLSQSALKLERNAFSRKNSPPWEQLEGSFEHTLAALEKQPRYVREKRQVERLMHRMQSGGSSYFSMKRKPHVFPREHEAFLAELARYDWERAPEMMHLIERHLRQFVPHQRQGLVFEIGNIVPPSLIELMLVSSDNYDDEVIVEILNSSEAFEDSHWREMLGIATPRLRTTRMLLADTILGPKMAHALRAESMSCLANSSEIEPDIAKRLSRFFLTDGNVSSPTHDQSLLTEYSTLLQAHRKSFGIESLDRIKQFCLGRALNFQNESEDRVGLISFLCKTFPLDPLVVDAIGTSLSRLENDSTEISDLLSALPRHGSQIKRIRDVLLRLALTANEYDRELAFASLIHIDDLDSDQQELLLNLILDSNQPESVRASSARVLAVQKEGTLKRLQDALHLLTRQPADSPKLQALVRTIELCGIQDPVLDSLLKSLAGNQRVSLEDRIAAWHARAVTAESSDRITLEIRTYLKDDENEPEARAAAAIAMARICGACSIPILTQFTHVDSPILRISSRYAHHLAGESNSAVHLLMSEFGELDSEDENTSTFLKNLLLEIGIAGQKSLRTFLNAPSASVAQRAMAFRILAESKAMKWNELVALIDESELGEAYERSTQAAWHFEKDLVPALYMRILDVDPTSRLAKRMWRLAEDTTMGLGAGGDENIWSDSSMRMALIDSASQSVADSEETMKSTPPSSPPRMSASAPNASAPSLKKEMSASESATSSLDETAQHSPEVSHGPERLTQTLSSFQPKDTRLNKDDRLVEVYYGTNRQTRTLPSLGISIRWGAFGISLLCFLVCVVAFATQRSMRYAFVALLGLLGLTALARDSLDMAYWIPERAGLYSGDYSKEIKYGVCEVSIPPKHTPGELESPSLLLQWEVRPDPEKHIVLKKTLPLEKDQFLSQLKQCMNQRGKNLLVFVHGYNVSFDDAARRTAQMWFDLKFEGAPVFYSWPSYSNWYRYPDDATNIELSVAQIQTFLQQLAHDSGAESINLIAHSMGNVGLTRALASMQASQPVFNQIVLAAPDIDADVFRGEIAPNIMNKAKRITIYTSKTDLALVASRYFNSRKPLGDSNYGSLSLAGIDTIDATSVDSSLLGHSYYGSNVSVLDDIASLLSGKAISDRPHLKLQAESNPPYWEFSSQTRTATSASPQRQ